MFSPEPVNVNSEKAGQSRALISMIMGIQTIFACLGVPAYVLILPNCSERLLCAQTIKNLAQFTIGATLEAARGDLRDLGEHHAALAKC